MKIIETHNLSVDASKVASAWRELPNIVPLTSELKEAHIPISGAIAYWFLAGEEDSRPTGRAIRERIVKIKEMSKNATLNGLTEPATPTLKRARAKVTKTPEMSTQARKRRKKNNQDSVDEKSPSESDPKIPNKRTREFEFDDDTGPQSMDSGTEL